MAESSITIGSKFAHTNSRTINAVLVEDEYTLPGEYPNASYTVLSGAVSTATAASHLLQIMAGASLNVRIRWITIREGAAPGAVGALELNLVRLTTAGTGGGAVTPQKMDNGDAASGATAMTLPTVKGAEGALLRDTAIWLGTAAIPIVDRIAWEQHPGMKPIIIPAGATNGIAIKNVTGLATSTLYIEVGIVETNFV